MKITPHLTRRGLTVAAIVVALVPTLIGSRATAAPATPSPQPYAAAGAAHVKGYTVTSVAAVAPHQNPGEATAPCPQGLKPIGGGVSIASSSRQVHVVFSIPEQSPLGWVVELDNVSSTDVGYRVYAECAKGIGSYSVVGTQGTVASPHGQQSTATVTCPTGTVPLGGGGSTNGLHGFVALNTSEPTADGWRVDVNNSAATADGDGRISAGAVCGKRPAGYAVQRGPGSTYGPSAQGSDTASCPSGTEVLGGGGYSNSNSTSVDLGSTYPTGQTGWISSIDDTGSEGSTVAAYAVCAKP